MGLDRDDIAALTHEYGGEWSLQHTRRLLHLVSLVREERDYDEEVVWLRGARDATRTRGERLPGLLCLQTSTRLAEARLSEMDDVLAAFERDSFDLF
jgi:hypothetical protein